MLTRRFHACVLLAAAPSCWHAGIAALMVQSWWHVRLIEVDSGTAGMTQEVLEPLKLVHSQRTALLQILLQLERLRLAMRGAQRTYMLP